MIDFEEISSTSHLTRPKFDGILEVLLADWTRISGFYYLFFRGRWAILLWKEERIGIRGELAVSPFFKFKQRSEKSYQSRLLSTGAIRYQTPSPTLHFCVLRDSAKYVPIHAIGETGMMSTRLPPMWPGFKSWRRRHMCRFSILLRKVSLQVIRLPLSSRQEVSLLKPMSNPSSI